MTPTETAAILRQFNEWSRGDEDIPQFDPREIGEAIDAAVEMIERLEAAESDALEQARLNGMGASREAALMAKLEAAEKSDAESIAMYRKARDERDALRTELADLRSSMTFRTSLIGRIEAERDALQAKVEAMEKQEPYAFAVAFPESSRVELVHDLDDLYEDLIYEAHVVRKLYLAPGAKGE